MAEGTLSPVRRPRVWRGRALRRVGALSLALWLGVVGPVHGADAPDWDTFSDTWVATDALGRSLPTHAEVGGPKPHKTAGIFYFLWLGSHGTALYDISRLLAANPTQPAWGPPGAFHFWGEPLLGYYLSDDAFVIRKHAQMLTDAGVEVVIFDVTNGPTYEPVVHAVARVYRELRRDGQRTPQFAFITHSGGAQVAQRLHDVFYGPGLYAELWFRWQGRPLLLARESELSPALREFFTVRESWAWSRGHEWFGDGKDKWPWLDHYPQTPGWHDSPAQPEAIPVAVAQHPTSNIGRSFHAGRQPSPGQTATEQGLGFAEQWRRALEVSPEFVFITGWNEWVAQRFVSEPGGQTFLGQPLPAGGTFFVDQFSAEFSRDIEPMQGGHGDNFYYQMTAANRRFKGVRPLPPVQPRRIRVDGDFADWREVAPEFRDAIGDPVRRDHPGWQGAGPYRDASGRNDIVTAKVSFDQATLYFYVRTRAPLTSWSDSHWMLLFLDTDRNATNGWLGYDWVVNRATERTAKRTTLERHAADGYRWGLALGIDYRAAGNELELAIPRAALGLKSLPAWIDFKWADNLTESGAAGDFTLHGDAAPSDRFNYRARLELP